MEKVNTTAQAAQAVIITKAQAPAIVAALLRKYNSVSGIKAHEAEIRAKYGAKSWPIIKAEAKAQRIEAVKTHEAGAKAGVCDWAGGLNDAYKAARKSGDFGKLEAMAAAKYPTGADFIAACYPNTIDGRPAGIVNYITGEPGSHTIVAAYQPLELDGRKARAYMYIAIGQFAKAIAKAEAKAGFYEAPTQARKAGAVVAAYNTKPGARLGTIAKAEAVAAEILAQYSRGNVAGLTTLSAYNAEAAKAYELAKAADTMAAATGEPISAQAAEILAREPRHNWLSTKPAKAPTGHRIPKAAKAPKAPKAATGSEAKAQAQAKAKAAEIDAFIAANNEAAKAGAVVLNA